MINFKSRNSGFFWHSLAITALLCGFSIWLAGCGSDNGVEDPVLLEFLSPLSGGSWAADDAVDIELRFLRNDSISVVYVEFSVDSGITFDNIRAEKNSLIHDGYTYNSYRWIPQGNSVTAPAQVLLRAYNYMNHSQAVTIPKPISITD
jgi:hypothetical protein